MVDNPTLSTTQSGVNMARFKVAVTRPFSGRNGQPKEADFFTCVAWRNNADFVAKYMAKGRKVCVEGRMENRSYEKDGVKHYTWDLIADNVEACDRPNGNGNGGQQGYQQQNNAPVQQQGQYTSPSGETFEEVTDDSLPF